MIETITSEPRIIKSINPAIWRLILLDLSVDFKFIPHAPDSLDVITLII